jgi:hypothetical protein
MGRRSTFVKDVAADHAADQQHVIAGIEQADDPAIEIGMSVEQDRSGFRGMADFHTLKSGFPGSEAFAEMSNQRFLAFGENIDDKRRIIG